MGRGDWGGREGGGGKGGFWKGLVLEGGVAILCQVGGLRR